LKSIFKFSHEPKFENPSLIVGWDRDAGQLGPKVIEYLNRKINSRIFCEIEPVDFFSLAGVTIEKNIAQFPEGKFYCCERGFPQGGVPNDLVIFIGSEPGFERYRFLDGICDLAQHYCRVKELFTVNGTISSIAHTNPRKILAVYNTGEFQKELQDYGLEDMNWQGPPAISSYLLWVAKRKGIPGMSLWTQIPFYLASGKDFQAIKLTLSFLDRRFNLELDLAELDEQIAQQNTTIARLRQENSEINRYIGAVESGLSLSEQEQLELIKAVTECLEERD